MAGVEASRPARRAPAARVGGAGTARVEPAFDGWHPPEPALLADCVHCGFCLPACPTYALWGEEMDSPRGRLLLMDLAGRGEIGLTPAVVGHWDACLGCMACETACPSGVRYGHLIERTRQQVERRVPRARADRALRATLFAVLPHHRRVRVAAVLSAACRRSGLSALGARSGLLDRLPPGLRALDTLAPPLRRRGLGPAPPRRTAPRTGRPRLRVALLLGCVQRGLFADVNAATARVLAAAGCEVLAPRAQGCCGALELHAGREAAALRRARRLVAVLERAGGDAIAVNSAGCGSTLKEYGELLADDPAWAARAAAVAARTRDVHELLVDLDLPGAATLAPLPLRVAYHDACHLAHAQRVRAQPRALLSAIPELTLVPLAEPDLCCGSAGVYNLVRPEAAAELGRRKAAHVRAAAPDAVAAANPGCLVQIAAHLGRDGGAVPSFHPVELLDASLRGLPPWALVPGLQRGG